MHDDMHNNMHNNRNDVIIDANHTIGIIILLQSYELQSYYDHIIICRFYRNYIIIIILKQSYYRIRIIMI